MLTLKCAKCKSKLFKYYKVGTGKVLRCYFARISKDRSIRKNDQVLCECGNVIGKLESNCIRMKQNSFIYSGTKVK
ncbi:MAG: hypothetical protein K9N09_01270 [Candidatus Cloacimonetes bacterium]|nr:hypothetical protein [Candidatus Cloacimonadota bacterium]MCF7812964.1 hypothetical protein [Candidatus Cloacimonadota bacterium]MCF7867304.1 hypothetical protein [Candidatus Cloacimonadota bacterium]MCF7882748.1 hypothetical protein [Candidatus Cloacimonadota bacterium]